MGTHHSKLISQGALIGLVGYVASGPLGFVLVQAVQPQPSWTSAEAFVRNYHVVQDIPFYFGFLLLAGMIMLAAGYYLASPAEDPDKKFRLLLALVSTTVFTTLISFNYVSQTTFIRHLALNYTSEYNSSIAIFSMANPLSFCWANEIWGYGFLGVATWLASAYYPATSRWIRVTMVANGIVSIATVVAVILDTSWLITTAGIVAYFVWNVLMITMMILIYRDARSSMDTPHAK